MTIDVRKKRLDEYPTGTKVRLHNGTIARLRVFKDHYDRTKAVDIEISPDVFLRLLWDDHRHSYVTGCPSYEIMEVLND